MSTSRSIYVLFIWSTFHYHFTTNNIISLKQTHLLRHFCRKFSFRVLLSLCLILCQFQLSFAYKSIAYVNKRVIEQLSHPAHIKNILNFPGIFHWIWGKVFLHTTQQRNGKTVCKPISSLRETRSSFSQKLSSLQAPRSHSFIYVQFSEKLIFFTPSFAHWCVCIGG